MICTKCKMDLPESGFDEKKVNGKPSGRLKKVCSSCCREIGRGVSRHNRAVRKLNAKGLDYSSRNANLRRLGFATYKEYLASHLWKKLRQRVFSVKGKKCYLCGSGATELHHNRYHTNDLTGARLKYINPICRQCHESIEFKGDDKCTVSQAKRAFNKQRRALKKATKA